MFYLRYLYFFFFSVIAFILCFNFRISFLRVWCLVLITVFAVTGSLIPAHRAYVYLKDVPPTLSLISSLFPAHRACVYLKDVPPTLSLISSLFMCYHYSFTLLYSCMIHIEDNVSNKCGRGYFTELKTPVYISNLKIGTYMSK